jgi:hypothetical protein
MNLRKLRGRAGIFRPREILFFVVVRGRQGLSVDADQFNQAGGRK